MADDTDLGKRYGPQGYEVLRGAMEDHTTESFSSKEKVPLPQPDPRGDWTHAVWTSNPRRIDGK